MQEHAQEYRQTVGEQLARARCALGIKVVQVARATGLHTYTLARLESGDSMTLDNLHLLAHYYGREHAGDLLCALMQDIGAVAQPGSQADSDSPWDGGVE